MDSQLFLHHACHADVEPLEGRLAQPESIFQWHLFYSNTVLFVSPSGEQLGEGGGEQNNMAAMSATVGCGMSA